MPLLSTPKGNVLLVHVPKTGGTSIEFALKRASKRALFFSGASKEGLHGLPCSPQHFHAELLRLLVPESFVVRSYMVVRHPVDRLVSEYRYRQGLLGRELLPFGAWWGACRLAFRRNPYCLDNHIRPQYEFEPAHCRVFKFEDGIDNVIGKIAKDLGLKLPTGKNKHIKRSKGPSVIVSPRVRRSIAAFYEQDFIRYKYEA